MVRLILISLSAFYKNVQYFVVICFQVNSFSSFSPPPHFTVQVDASTNVKCRLYATTTYVMRSHKLTVFELEFALVNTYDNDMHTVKLVLNFF